MNKAIDELRKSLASVDLYTRKHNKHNFNEFLVLKFQNIKIKMYQEIGHKRPHIHIDYGNTNHVASYAVDNSSRISGNLDKKYDKKIKNWINNNRRMLIHLWEQANSGKDIKELLIGLKNA
ncbi:MAG: DUF4160 domain-containing protein [Candidatus Auribacterota bacterium]|nr:DUF4160 domain-containing protein [Candidatus Auribacterota bacterium]